MHACLCRHNMLYYANYLSFWALLLNRFGVQMKQKFVIVNLSAKLFSGSAKLLCSSVEIHE